MKAYDLPDSAAAVAPRPLTLRAPQYPLRRGPVPAQEAEDAHARCRAAYAALGAADRFILRSNEARPPGP